MSRSLLLEIGCEELPASFVRSGTEQLVRLATEQLAALGVTHGPVEPLGSPRRIAVLVRDVADGIPARTEEIMGPSESAAKDKAGAWTKAAEGFAKKNGLELDQLVVVDTPKGRYLRAEKVHPGAATRDKLPAVLGALCSGVSFTKSMRWADVEQAFGRPVQWLVGLYGDEVVPFEFARVASGRTTRGHRFLAPAAIELANADAYVDAMRAAHVLVREGEKRAAQEKVLAEAAEGQGGELIRNKALEDEVLGLVEEPFAVVGHFDKGFLTLPDELIETVMGHHQRYFAARAKGGGALLPLFITTVNTALAPAKIRRNNETTMRARLSDARFFVEQDGKHSLESCVAKLDGVVYHPKLGSYGDKARRLEALAPWMAGTFGVDVSLATRAAKLAKADLVSLCVGEFPELQGIMGRHYAKSDFEVASVAAAVGEHYQPRTADDAVAPSMLGAALATADRVDTLVGFFAIGMKPSGGGDPMGLRRSALGVLRTVLHHRVRVDLREALTVALAGLGAKAPENKAAVLDELVAFVRERLENYLVQRFRVDVVRACMDVPSKALDPVDIEERVAALSEFRGMGEFAAVARAFERVFNISEKASEGDFDRALLTQPAEKGLLEAYDGVKPTFDERVSERRFIPALEALAATLPGPVDRFFTEVFVMDENLALRDARLRLLRSIARSVGAIARFDTLAATTA